MILFIIFACLLINKMQSSRNAHSETIQIANFHDEPSPGKDVKRTNKQPANISNPSKKLSPAPQGIALKKSHVSKMIAIDQKSNATEEIRIKGYEKLLYIKKCNQKDLSKQEIFENYPFSNMDAFTFEVAKLRNQEEGGFIAKIIETKSGIHLIQEYTEKLQQSKYVSISDEDEDSRLNGLSVSIFNDGTIFQGIYHDGHFCGMGYELQPNGNTYIGTFKDGVKNGNGTYYWFSNNQIFSGEWHGGLPHGTGVYLGGDSKDRYEGMFSNGLRYGFGVQTFANGDKYIGEYLNGVAEGYGEYFWSDGSIYKGDFKHGVRHGYGIWKDEKEVYQGSYRMDKKEGLGIYKWIGRQIYKGEFRDDFREGYGQFYRLTKLGKQSLVYKGCWTKGKKWEQGKPDESKLKELYVFLDESFKIQKQLQQLSKKNEPKARVGHKNCIPHDLSQSHIKI